MDTISWVFVEVCAVHSFNNLNKSFVDNVTFFRMKFLRRIYFHGKFATFYRKQISLL